MSVFTANERIRCSGFIKRCTYEYDDVGLAYYAGLRGDNWDKKAIDITFEGSSSDINCLKNNKSIFETALEKAIKLETYIFSLMMI